MHFKLICTEEAFEGKMKHDSLESDDCVQVE